MKTGNSSQLLRNGHFEVTPEKGNFMECGGHKSSERSEEDFAAAFSLNLCTHESGGG
jgi:hypothetical protein